MIEKVAMRGTLRRLVVVPTAIRTDTGETMANVGGVRDLPQFAVADAVDPGSNLLGDNLADSGGELRLERRLIEVAAGLARLQKGQQIRRARQAADMGRQDAVGAELHFELPGGRNKMVSRAARSRKLWWVANGRPDVGQ